MFSVLQPTIRNISLFKGLGIGLNVEVPFKRKNEKEYLTMKKIIEYFIISVQKRFK